MDKTTTIDDGGPAFPMPVFPNTMFNCLPDGTVRPVGGGMSLRDWFAGLAMAAIVSHQQHGSCEITDRETLANCAYEVADAMLAERKRGTP